MTTTEYLNSIKRFEAIIENKIFEIANIESMATNITVAMDKERVQTSGDKDRVGSAVVKIIDKVDRLEKILSEYYEKRDVIISQIEHIEKTEEYRVLFYRFVMGLPIDKIAENMNYSERHIKTLQTNALKSFEAKYGEIYRNEPYIFWVDDFKEE